ncbi:hypothetical protein [Streptosporangium subroseum]|uniref:hypothetical protein n=1 Tax=Streptosporangium subroseum TaxID=106412 RepID=UPI00308CDB2E|nr:hypothetical protein OHB15_41515 [Streptosporangium subroseum]
MLPPYGTPGSDQLNAARWRPGARTILQHLRAELHTHKVMGAMVYDGGQARLVISVDLTVWTDDAGTVFCWGAHFLEEPADHAPVDDLPGAARRIAELHHRGTNDRRESA